MSKKYLFLLLPVFLVGCGAQPNQSTQTGETQQSLSGTDQSIISGDVQDSLTGDQSDQISGDAQSSDKDSSKDVVKSDIKALHEKELAKIKKDTYFKTE